MLAHRGILGTVSLEKELADLEDEELLGVVRHHWQEFMRRSR